jgi:hypothetical protein
MDVTGELGSMEVLSCLVRLARGLITFLCLEKAEPFFMLLVLGKDEII